MVKEFQAVRIHENGGLDVLSVDKIKLNGIPQGHVLIKNKYTGINFIDTYHRSGLYDMKLPFTLGMEGGGIISELGQNVNGSNVGDKVVYLGAFGSYSEYSIVPAEKVVIVPEKLEMKMAVAALLQGLTAEFLVNFIYPLKKGDVCLIQAAAGGVGLLLVQMAKIVGARVIGTVSTEEKAQQVLDVGADEVIIYTKQDFEDEVKKMTNGRGVNVVYDSVGQDTFYRSLNCLTPFGYMVTFGNSSGPVPAIEPLELNKRGSLFLSRPSLLHYVDDTERLRKGSNALFQYILSGKINVNIGRELPLEQAAEAHRALEARETIGKVLLKI